MAIPISKHPGIYRICVDRGIGTKFYVGHAVDLRARWFSHLRKLQMGKHRNIHLQRAFLRYGECAFAFQVVLICERRKEILEMYEQIVVDFHESNDLYNMCLQCVGSRTGIKSRPETVAKIIAKNMGRKHTPESIELIKIGKKGFRPSPEHMERLRQLRIARGRMSDDIRNKIAETLKGRQKSNEEIARRTATRRANAELRGRTY